MKFLVPNYSCPQNPLLGGYCPQTPVLSVLNWICWTPPPRKKSWVRHWCWYILLRSYFLVSILVYLGSLKVAIFFFVISLDLLLLNCQHSENVGACRLYSIDRNMLQIRQMLWGVSSYAVQQQYSVEDRPIKCWSCERTPHAHKPSNCVAQPSYCRSTYRVSNTIMQQPVLATWLLQRSR